MKNEINSSFLLFLFLTACNSSKNLELINSQFQDSNYVEGRYTGLVGAPSQNFKSFTSLWDRLNKRDKIELAKNGSLVSKFQASEKIVNEKSNEIIEVFKHNLEDQRTVEYLNGDVKKPTEISIQMLDRVNELIKLKSEDSLSIVQSVKILPIRIKDFKKAERRKEIYRPGFVEYLGEELKYAKEIDNWTLGELYSIQRAMLQEIYQKEKVP